MESNKLFKDVLATIVYYDGLKFPLTSFEIWKYLLRTDYYNQEENPKTFSIDEVLLALENDALKKFISNSNGFYFLKGNEYLVEKRIKRGKIASAKIKRLRRIVWLLRFVPFVRMIGVTGGLAMKNTHAKSDWDLLIVLSSKHIWTGRLLVTLFVHLFKQRRHGKSIKDRVCLNYYITDETLEISTKDLFSSGEYFFLYPLFGKETYISFQLRNNWIRTMRPQYSLTEVNPLGFIEDSAAAKSIRVFGEKILSFGIIESVLRNLQLKRIMNNPKTKKEGSLIKASDDALVFLPDPRGPKLFEKFKETIENLHA